MWIDTHAHLDPGDFVSEQGEDETEIVLKRAHEAGIQAMVVIGSGHGIAEVESAFIWARKKPNCYAALGVHPHHADIIVQPKPDVGTLSGEALFRHIERLVKAEPKVVAIGETGLDLHYEYAPFAQQVNLFERFLLLSKETQKPLSLHIRDAHAQALDMVKHVGGLKGVVHCFTGTVAEAKAWIEQGFFLSFSGIVTFPKANQVHESCKYAPLDRVLLETDCPYLAPVPMRGKRNEPAFLTYTAAYVASLKEIALTTLADQTTQNAKLLFGLEL